MDDQDKEKREEITYCDDFYLFNDPSKKYLYRCEFCLKEQEFDEGIFDAEALDFLDEKNKISKQPCLECYDRLKKETLIFVQDYYDPRDIETTNKVRLHYGEKPFTPREKIH